MSDKILSSSNTSKDNIIDSTKSGFVSTYKNPRDNKEPEQQRDTSTNPKALFEKQIKKDLKTKTTRQEEVEAINLVKSMMKKRAVNLKSNHMKFCNMIFYRYMAKDKSKPFDRTPMVLTLSASGTHMLGLNLHWCPVPLRIAFIRQVLNLNMQAIQNNKPFVFTYKMAKPLIERLNLKPVIKLYIIKRMSSKVVPIPPELWLTAIKLRAETFTGGYTSESIYKAALAGKI